MHNPFQEIAERLNSIESILADLQKVATSATTPIEPELLDVAQAASFLRLTTQTVYDKVHARTLPHVKQGNRIYFFKDELIGWLKAGRQQTVEQQTDQAREVIAASVARRQRKGGRSSS
ncbi:helix-turn-helix domain-containing protein [Spirosoma sp. SC4-14]|uniref:helix-turn-helix domain-containing protein n=1 Tax=Spirosoma sp. SC4-14 TaxID=3128900 RepID=UPI0030D0BA2D